MTEKYAYWLTMRGLTDGGSNQINVGALHASSNCPRPAGYACRSISSETNFPLGLSCSSSLGRGLRARWRSTHQTIPSCLSLLESSVAKNSATYGEAVQSSNRVGKR